MAAAAAAGVGVGVTPCFLRLWRRADFDKGRASLPMKYLIEGWRIDAVQTIDDV